ncbi:Spo0B domain-containing protein [Paenibacillus solisilvae]|uniref:Spo0B domain-containing protein n=1 Tax=Paenibacillus solisilvae TaxID=2486751 RepID=A0ABW0W029_9BACL
MNRLRLTKLYAAASALLPAAAVLIWQSELWLLAVFVAWIVIAALIWVWCERKEYEWRMARSIHALQSASIRTLNHHRHDWMNDLQVLYGYIRMNKADKTVQYVEQIRDRMMTESKIAKLGIPSLVTFMQSFRTLTHTLQFEVGIEGELNLSELPFDGDQAAETIVEFINAYRFSAKPSMGEAAKLTVDLAQEEKALSVSFRYEGSLNDMSEWKQKCKRALEGSPLKPVDPNISPERTVLQAQLGN